MGIIHSNADFSLLILITGAIIVATIFLKAGMERIAFPPLVGFLVLGLAIRVGDEHWTLLSEESHNVILFMARVGLVTLLFRIGLESKLGLLLHQLRRASVVWLSNVLFSALAGFAAAYVLLQLGLISSIIVAAALTATSVGISTRLWQDAKALQSDAGELLVDVAELDDISAIMVLVVLFAVLPILHNDTHATILPVIGTAAGLMLLKLAGFMLLCFLFSRYAEERLTTLFQRLEPVPDPMLMVMGVAFMIAAIAGLLDFSLAIGAFFAGLVFSRDPRSVKMEASFLPLYELFSPFFFIGIGLEIDPASISAAVLPGLLLLIAAVIGKIVGVGLPLLPFMGRRAAALVGLSMVPRAEICMLIMLRGFSLGDWAVSAKLFSAMTLVATLSCIVTPIAVRPLLARFRANK